MKIEIVLATYNGAKFLKAQLDSLLQQSYGDWQLIARDDGSTDETVAILDKFSRRFPHRIRRMPTQKRLGVVGNFSQLLLETTAPYICLCDQDDIWKVDKLETMITAMKKAEVLYSPELPLLLHSDLELIDQTGCCYHPSFWRFAHLNIAKGEQLARLLSQNIVTGCSTLCNRALLQKALPIPEQALMHDWWLALIASAFGKIISLPDATTCYRQHADNVLGARRLSLIEQCKRLISRWGHSDPRKHGQAQQLQERHHHQLSSSQQQLLQSYLALPQSGHWKRLLAMLYYGFGRHGALRQLAFILKIID